MVRRLIVALTVVAIMVATMAGGALSAGAQTPGATVSCAPWEKAWYVSQSEWWYYWWWWRWCYNPSLEQAWYVDWAGWGWNGYAGSEYSPGYHVGGP